VPRLITFGGLALTNGTLPTGIGNPRNRLAILAVLAMSRERGIRREKLAAMFWPESDEERARNALRQALFTLKRDIGAAVVTGATDVRLNVNVLTADVIEFETAVHEGRSEDAAALYAGPFLDGVYLRESPEFERWAEEHRNRLSAEFGRALEKAADNAAACADRLAAVHWWERRSMHDPLSGRVARHYIDALAKAGESERAIRHAAVYSDLVRKELDADPDPEVMGVALRLGQRHTPMSPHNVTQKATISGNVEFENLPDPSLKKPNDTKEFPNVDVGRAITHSSQAEQPPRVRARSRKVGTLILRPEQKGVSLGKWSLLIPIVFAGLLGACLLRRIVPVVRIDLTAEDWRLQAYTQRLEASIISLLDRAHLRVESRTIASIGWEQMRGINTGHVISGRLTLKKDSVHASIGILEASSGREIMRLASTAGPVGSSDQLSRVISDRAVGALAQLRDTVFRVWESGLSQPGGYNAFSMLLLAQHAYNIGNVKLARERCNTISSIEPRFVQGRFWCIERTIPYTAAVAGLDSLLADLGRESLWPYDRAAVNYLFARRARETELVYQAALTMASLAPGSTDAKYRLARAAISTRRGRQAVAALHAAQSMPGSQLSGLSLWLLESEAHKLAGDAEPAHEFLRPEPRIGKR
jgi:DNA-binding SARP family transcriptional activator